MFRQVENLWQRYRHMHVLGRVAVKMGIALLFFISAPSGGRLLGPVAMLLFWIILSTETRTITFSSMILATVAGLMVFIPAATIMELPLILIFGKETMAAALACQSVEMLLIIAVLVLLNLSPRSRLRYTAGILDFVLVGLCLGVGLECGLGFLYPPAAGHGGRALGVLPQLPGLLGHQRLPVACASPAAWGMVYGLLAGISRYLIGPDFNGSWLRRGMVIGLAVVLWLWLLGERAGYIMGTTTGFWNVLHWIDLKGRLLSYSAGLLTLGVILVEWLLLQEKSGTGSRSWQQLKTAWETSSHSSWYNRIPAIFAFLEQRGLGRELIWAGEAEPVLAPDDRAWLNKRVRWIQSRRASEGGV